MPPSSATISLVFSDYMRPSIRIAAITGLPVIYVFTHDSIFVGEDGPTHEPIEHFAVLRAIPHLTVIRPADANETAVAWQAAIENRHGPTVLLLSRQNLPVLDQAKYGSAQGLLKGAYVLSEAAGGKVDMILIATGSEVSIAMEGQKLLAEQGVAARVVSMPSWELFNAQPQTYRDSVLPPTVKARLAIEAGIPMGWERYVGDAGEILAIENRYGASAPYKTLAKEYGLTGENVAKRALGVLKK
jgi:transketolase